MYCKFRDEQLALYNEYAKRHGMLMKTLLVVNVLYYDDFYDKGGVTLEERKENKREKLVRITEAGKAYCEKVVHHITWAEDTAMSMFTQEEQKQLIELSRTFTKNLTDLIHQEPED